MAKAKLSQMHSHPLPKGTGALTTKQINDFLKQLKGWKIEKEELVRHFSFENYFETMSNVIAIAMLAQSEDHHPDMLVGYNKLTVRYSTHSVGGLSENDFICAAKIEGLMKSS